jgi:hypothetical protein
MGHWWRGSELWSNGSTVSHVYAMLLDQINGGGAVIIDLIFDPEGSKVA